MKKCLALLVVTSFAATAFAQIGKKPFQPKDFYKIPTVSDPQVSPDGKWVAYGVSEVDTAKDKRVSQKLIILWIILTGLILQLTEFHYGIGRQMSKKNLCSLNYKL